MAAKKKPLGSRAKSKRSRLHLQQRRRVEDLTDAQLEHFKRTLDDGDAASTALFNMVTDELAIRALGMGGRNERARREAMRLGAPVFSDERISRQADKRNAKTALARMSKGKRRLRKNTDEHEYGFVSRPFINWNVLIREMYEGEHNSFRVARVVGHVTAADRVQARAHAKYQLKLNKAKLDHLILIPGERKPIGARWVEGEWRRSDMDTDPQRRRLRARKTRRDPSKKRIRPHRTRSEAERQYKREMREAAKARGECYACTEPAIEGMRACVKHLMADRARNKKRMDKKRAMGLCAHSSCTEKPREGASLCEKHHIRNEEGAKRRRHHLSIMGLCQAKRCNRPLAEGSKQWCNTHIDSNLQFQKEQSTASRMGQTEEERAHKRRMDAERGRKRRARDPRRVRLRARTRRDPSTWRLPKRTAHYQVFYTYRPDQTPFRGKQFTASQKTLAQLYFSKLVREHAPVQGGRRTGTPLAEEARFIRLKKKPTVWLWFVPVEGKPQCQGRA